VLRGVGRRRALLVQAAVCGLLPRRGKDLAALLVHGPHAPDALGATELGGEALGARFELTRLSAADAARLDDVGLVRLLAEHSERIDTGLLISRLLRRLRKESSGLSQRGRQRPSHSRHLEEEPAQVELGISVALRGREAVIPSSLSNVLRHAANAVFAEYRVVVLRHLVALLGCEAEKASSLGRKAPS